MRFTFTTLCVSALVMFALASVVQADAILSAKSDAWLDGDYVESGDLFTHDSLGDTTDILFDGGLLGGAGDNIDAAHLTASGTLILSTTNGSTLAGLEFEDGDLVEYDPMTQNITKVFDQSLFRRNEDIDAVFVEDGGAIVMSTTNSAELAGMEFGAGDIVRYDPVSQAVTLLFDEDLFSKKVNIDAVHVMPGGDLLFSTDRSAELFGVQFTNNDLIQYNPVTQDVTLYWTEARDWANGAAAGGKGCGNGKGAGNGNGCSEAWASDINALTFSSPSVPEPTTLSLVALGGVVLLSKRLRRVC